MKIVVMRCVFSHILSNMEKLNHSWISCGGHGELIGTLIFTSKYLQYFRGYFDSTKILNANTSDFDVLLFRCNWT